MKTSNVQYALLSKPPACNELPFVSSATALAEKLAHRPLQEFGGLCFRGARTLLAGSGSPKTQEILLTACEQMDLYEDCNCDIGIWQRSENTSSMSTAMPSQRLMKVFPAARLRRENLGPKRYYQLRGTFIQQRSRLEAGGSFLIERRFFTFHMGYTRRRMLFDQMRGPLRRRDNVQFDIHRGRVVIVVGVIAEGHQICCRGEQKHNSQHRPTQQSVQE